MNKSDSERIAAILEEKGYKPVSNVNEADLIMVNMCSVRQSAADRVYGLIPKFQKLKLTLRQAQGDGEPRRTIKTVLTGCILKQDRKKFRKRFDEIWEMKNYFKIAPKCQNNSQVFVPISNGCNNFCSYCVVPYTRGSLICRPYKEILKEVKNLIKNGSNPIRNTISNGTMEIWLLGQNVNDYQSPANLNINFAKLLRMVNDVPGDFQIRFMSPHPADFTDELIDTMAKSKKVAKYINLPVQSGDNEILKRMNRPYTIEQYKNLVKKIREKIPDINLTTDIIVGFPGETKKQFENTVKLFKKMKFNLAYIAKYSPRPGTTAFQMKDNIPLKEKKRREKILRRLLSLPRKIKEKQASNRPALFA